MPKKFYREVPDDYPVCVHDQCPKAQQCLRQIGYGRLAATETLLRMVNPLRCTQDDDCPFYRSAEPVVWARGFAHFQHHMFPEQYKQFMFLLIQRFGRNAYFERRRGDTALSPTEQEMVMDALRTVGVTEPLSFQSSEKTVNWEE